jgi:hypothetical protein
MAMTLDRLNPIIASGDLQARMQSTIQELTNRVDALERKADPTFTPFVLTAPGTPTLNFGWNGGRLWVVYGGQATSTGTGGGTQQVGATMSINLLTGILPTTLTAETDPAARLTALPMRTFEIHANYLDRAGNVLTASVANAFTASVYVPGLIIEWPSP